MGDINTCLKRTFTIFNILFAIVGGLIILLAVLAQILTSNGAENLENRSTSLIMLYVVGSITMVIAILGAYGAHREKRGPLIAFLVCMVIGSLIMLRVGITTAIARPQIERLLEETFHKFIPLDQAAKDVQEMTNTLQSQMHCCGFFSYKDWNNIPNSCLCSDREEEEGLCKSISFEGLFVGKSMGKSVYSKPCFPILMHYVILITDIFLGIFFTLAIFALLGLGLSSLMIHQMRYANRPPVMLTVPAVFYPQPPKYQELHNSPSYPGY